MFTQKPFFIAGAAVLGLCAWNVPGAKAQGLIPLLPFQYTGDLYISDPGTDSVYRLMDLNGDGTYNGPGEIVRFYDDTLGNFNLTNCNSVAVGPNGVVYVGDSSEQNVFAMADLNGDGTANGPNESWIFFDGNGNNAENITTGSPANMTIDALGRIWMAVSGKGSTSPNNVDKIVVLADLNGDGNANGPFESFEYYIMTPSSPLGLNVPQDVQIGFDGHLYMLDIPSTGSLEKGVYRLNDANGDGLINDASEAPPFFIPPPQSSNPFFWGMTIDADGYFYIADTLNWLIWRFRDEDGDGVVDPLTEATLWWQSPVSSRIWRLAANSDGSIYGGDAIAPRRVLRFEDLDGDGVIDPVTEVTEVYNETIADLAITNTRSIAFDRRPTIFGEASPSIGQSTGLTLLAALQDDALLYASSATIPPLNLPPFGFLELNPIAPGFQLLWFGNLGGFATQTLTYPIPNNPSLVGGQVHFQALVGKASRLRLSNLFTWTLQ